MIRAWGLGLRVQPSWGPLSFLGTPYPAREALGSLAVHLFSRNAKSRGVRPQTTVLFHCLDTYIWLAGNGGMEKKNEKYKRSTP